MAHCSDQVDSGLSPPPYEAIVPFPPPIPPPGGTGADVKHHPLLHETNKDIQVNNQERQPILANPTAPPLQEYQHEVREAVPSMIVSLENPSFLCRKRKTFLVKMYCAFFITCTVLFFIVVSALSEGMKDTNNSTVPFNHTDINDTLTSGSVFTGNGSFIRLESVLVIDDIQ